MRIAVLITAIIVYVVGSLWLVAAAPPSPPDCLACRVSSVCYFMGRPC